MRRRKTDTAIYRQKLIKSILSLGEKINVKEVDYKRLIGDQRKK
jgi:hypothetical protein